MAAGDRLDLLLEMAIRPDWRNVDILRTAVLACVNAVAVKGTHDGTIGVIASELVENAIKYGRWIEGESAPLAIRVASDGHVVEVSVSNPTDPDAESFAALRRTLAWIASFPTPEHAYLARMAAMLDQDSTEAGSRMGLVRVVHEGPCTLVVELSPDRKIVVVRATAALT